MSALTQSLDYRCTLRLAEVIQAAARQAHEAGDDLLSVWLYDRARVCCQHLRLLERIDAEPERTLFALLPVQLPTPEKETVHVG